MLKRNLFLSLFAIALSLSVYGQTYQWKEARSGGYTYKYGNETARGGQVFYLHNRIESLEDVYVKLQQLLPEMMIETAHGRMSSGELDDIFRRFKMGGFHVLIATKIGRAHV